MKNIKQFVLLSLIIPVFAISAVLLEGTLNTTLYPQPTEKKTRVLKEGKPAFTVNEALMYIKEVLPLVEMATGKKFKKFPAIKLVDREDATNVMILDIIPQFRNLMPDKTAGQIMKAAEKDAKRTIPTLLARYGYSDKVLYLLPKNMLPLLKRVDRDKNHTKSVLKIILAHELTHALQDQEINLKIKVDQIEDFEELEAVKSTIEGHAVFVHEIVGNQLKLENANSDVFYILTGGSKKVANQFLEINELMSANRLKRIYYDGKRFIEYHYKKGGNKQVWEVLSAPPTDTSMILEPETYTSKHLFKLDYGKILMGLEKYFGESDLKGVNYAAPKMNLLATYSKQYSQLRDEIISKVVHVQVLEISKKNKQYGYVGIMKLKDMNYASKYIIAAEDIAKDNNSRMKKDSVYKIQNFSLIDFAGIEADISRKVSYRLKHTKGDSMSVMTTRICRGEIIVEIGDVNNNLTDDDIIKIVETVFKRYQETNAVHKHRLSDMDIFQKPLRKAS